MISSQSCGFPFGDPEIDCPWMNSGFLFYFFSQFMLCKLGFCVEKFKYFSDDSKLVSYFLLSVCRYLTDQLQKVQIVNEFSKVSFIFISLL